MPTPEQRYPSDGSEEEWASIAPYLTVVPPRTDQGTHWVHVGFNSLR